MTAWGHWKYPAKPLPSGHYTNRTALGCWKGCCKQGTTQAWSPKAAHIPSIPNLPPPFSIPQVHSRWTGSVPNLPDSNLPFPAKQPLSVSDRGTDRGTLVGNHGTTQTYASAPLGVSSESRSTKQPLSIHDSNPRIENSSVIPASSVSYLSVP